MIMTLEVIGILGILLFFSWAGLLWRLSQGPLNVDFLTKKLEENFNQQKTGFIVDAGRTELIWGGRFDPLELDMRDVHIFRDDKTPVLTVEKVGVQLSRRYLVFGKIVPKVIKVYSPELHVTRKEDGNFSLNIGKTEVMNTDAIAASVDQRQFISLFLTRLYEDKDLFLLGGLREIRITDAKVFYEDRIFSSSWTPEKADIVFARAQEGLLANTVFYLKMAEDHEAVIKSSVYYNGKTQKISVVGYFDGINPKEIAGRSAGLEDFSQIDLPLKGSVALDIKEGFQPQALRFVIGGDKGTLNARNIYTQPLKVSEFYLSGAYSWQTGQLDIDQMKAEFGGTVVSAELKAEKQPDGLHTGTVKAVLTDMPMDDLKHFWPGSLAPDARKWVTEQLSKGVATTATLDLQAAYDPAAEQKITVKTVGGKIDFKDIQVDYFSPLPVVTGASGIATYDKTSFNLSIAAASLKDMMVKNSKIHITGLDQQDHDTHAMIDIAADLDGPLKTALGVLDSEPLKYVRDLGLETDAKGDAAINVLFKFPLHHALTLAEVEVKAGAKLNNVDLKNVIEDYALTGGPFDLSFDRGVLGIKGDGLLGGMNVSFDWVKNFTGKEKFSNKVKAKIDLTGAALVKFGAPDGFDLAGSLAANLDYLLMPDGGADLSLRGDMSNLTFQLPMVGFNKLQDVPGKVDFLLHTKEGKPDKLSGLVMQTEGLFLAGDMNFIPAGRWTAALSKAEFGETAVAIDAAFHDTEGYQMKVRGKQLDISRLFEDDRLPGDDEAEKKTTLPIKIGMDVERLITGKDKSLDQVKMYMHKNAWGRLEQLEIDGTAGNKPLYLRYMPEPEGHSLKFEAENAGAALNALGISSSVRGGKLVVTGNPAPKSGARDMNGTIILTQFSLKDTPVLAKLLNAMSLVGILDMLQGQGISFRKARASFSWVDKGPPGDEKNMRLIKVRDGETSGSSLGLTFEGNIDNWKNVYDIKGTIIPVSDINKLLKVIPLVGNILTAGGEGVIAATYSVKGPKEQPTVTVNPLAALAPGILRKLFFEN